VTLDACHSSILIVRDLVVKGVSDVEIENLPDSERVGSFADVEDTDEYKQK
jgi:hypothetical protein